MKLFREILIKAHARSVLDIGVGAEWEGAQNTLHEAYSQGTMNIAKLVACGIKDPSGCASNMEPVCFGSSWQDSNPLWLPRLYQISICSFSMLQSTSVFSKLFLIELVPLNHGLANGSLPARPDGPGHCAT